MAARISLPVMEEKRPVRSRPFRRNRPLLSIAIIAVILYTLYRIHPVTDYAGQWVRESGTPSDSLTVTKNLVPLEAHIMSKCPDAKDCLKDMILPAMMRINEKVNFTLSYIGTPTDSNDGVQCKHGPEECMGNIIELCAAHLYPDPKIYLGFTMCLTRDYKEIPSRALVEDCALEHAIDFEKLNGCAAEDDGALGISMLRKSIKRTSDVRDYNPPILHKHDTDDCTLVLGPCHEELHGPT
ncbi:hypothetical protein BJ170DRAFT_680468 [Xylariales sp. AK1849]|nr:hypothetical protein BJ170DRAFT_680468 [Xylariales sp. AK1849]